jgi:hypothetical protein
MIAAMLAMIANSRFRQFKSRFRRKNFPIMPATGISLQALDLVPRFLAVLAAKGAAATKFPVIFPWNGNSRADGASVRPRRGTVLATRAFLALLPGQRMDAEETR